MRHYEIVMLVHMNDTEQLGTLLERYKTLIEASGTIHRFEDWGRQRLAYPIANLHRAHYFLYNIECEQKTLDELERLMRLNDTVLRHLTLRVDAPITGESSFLKNQQHQAEIAAERQARQQVQAEQDARRAEARVAAAAAEAKAEAEAADSDEAETETEAVVDEAQAETPVVESVDEATPAVETDTNEEKEGE